MVVHCRRRRHEPLGTVFARERRFAVNKVPAVAMMGATADAAYLARDSPGWNAMARLRAVGMLGRDLRRGSFAGLDPPTGEYQRLPFLQAMLSTPQTPPRQILLAGQIALEGQ